MKHQSPYIAKDWVENLVEEINNVQRKSDMDKALQSIEYLKNEMKKTQSVEVKQSISSLIEQQLKTIMVAKSETEYVFEILTNAYPNDKFSPNRLTISSLFLITSFIFQPYFHNEITF